MMIVTGATSFIGSCLIGKLNAENFNYLIAVDDFNNEESQKNLADKTLQATVAWPHFFDWLEQHYFEVEFLFHCLEPQKITDNQSIIPYHESNSVSHRIWDKCVEYQIPLIFTLPLNASSSTITAVHPSFEPWALQQPRAPFFWAGLQVPEVYGPNEYYLNHKASSVFRIFQQIKTNKEPLLNHSQHTTQTHDLLYVKDLLAVAYRLVRERMHSGIYTLRAVHEYTPSDILQAIQAALHDSYATDHLKGAAVALPSSLHPASSADLSACLTSLSEGVRDYVQGYLLADSYY